MTPNTRSEHPELPSQKGTSVTASDLVELAGRLETLSEKLLFEAQRDLLREAASALRERIPLPADGGAREALSNLLALFDDYRDSDLSHADAHACLVRYPVWEAARLALHPSSRGEAEQK